MSANNNREGLKTSDWAEPIIPNDPRYLPPKTLRDEFAMAALTGLLASDVQDGAAVFAKLSYVLADAMLEARKERPA